MTSKWAYEPLHQVAQYVKRLGIVLSMNVQQGIGFKNSGWEICPSVIKLEQTLDDEALRAAIEEGSNQTCGELARQFNTSSETVRLHLHRLEDMRQALTDFFASHTPEFYRKGIKQLETRWQKVLDADGDYFED
ncbi:histone-lysine N-methyltransferase SETMAR [Trichonephila inaurata madagascariensis]|uniref:Histone-lysine N-methyltransferase SETMAR n=1 Tax=Trichonephila inaurata madagascariensis TaxID=2747483 RepID=A0A8X6XN57_9ARAC|nr:histone-lysine N-methyltransferase SETMAR [Trichonephila inaurata madagascariensis]